MKNIKQYLLYTQTKEGSPQNWNIEKYTLWHDLQDRAMAEEIRKNPIIAVVEYEDGSKETIEDTRKTN